MTLNSESVRRISSPDTLAGTLSVPGDKSISHRALILNAMAYGPATVQGLSGGEDVRSTLSCLQKLGADIRPGAAPGEYHITGRGPQLSEPEEVLDAGNSGTSMRLLAGVLAAQDFLTVITGDGSLRSRPMGRIVEPLQRMGAQIMGRGGNALAPLALRGGKLQGLEYRLPVASAQVKSCILLAGLAAEGETLLHQPARSRDHTERMLSAMGAPVEEDGLELYLRPAELRAVDLAVPGDLSSAAFWMIAGLCHPHGRVLVQGVGLNPSRTGIIDALQMMGAGDGLQLLNHRDEGGEPVADVLATTAELRGAEIGGDLIPRLLDEIPALAVAACFAQGETVIRDAAELRVKESDRIATTVQELTRLGANIEARDDGMVIRGAGRLTGAACQSHGDHRLAMSLAVAGLLGRGAVEIHDAGAAAVSYPEFWADLAALQAGPPPEVQR